MSTNVLEEFADLRDDNFYIIDDNHHTTVDYYKSRVYKYLYDSGFFHDYVIRSGNYFVTRDYSRISYLSSRTHGNYDVHYFYAYEHFIDVIQSRIYRFEYYFNSSYASGNGKQRNRWGLDASYFGSFRRFAV